MNPRVFLELLLRRPVVFGVCDRDLRVHIVDELPRDGEDGEGVWHLNVQILEALEFHLELGTIVREEARLMRGSLAAIAAGLRVRNHVGFITAHLQAIEEAIDALHDRID
jgi:hypothetical protein